MRKLVPALALAALVAACGAPAGDATAPASASTAPLSEIAPVSDPRSLTGPSTAALTDSDVDVVVEDPQQQLPATVVSHDLGGDRKVTVTDTSRVIAMDMSGSLAATVWGLGFGDRLVARDISTQFPGVEDLPVITANGHSVNSEAVMAARPTLIITDGSIGPRDVVEQLRDAGVTVVFVEKDSSFDGAVDTARQVAEALGAPEAGEALAQRTQDHIDEVKDQIAAIAPADPDKKLRILFLYIRGASGIYYMFGESSGATDIAEGLGGIDVATDEGWEGLTPMTDEAVVKADPDLILVMTHGLQSAGGVDGLLEGKPAVGLTKAGKNRRIVDMADADVLSFGPRSGEVLAALARAVYAPNAS